MSGAISLIACGGSVVSNGPMLEGGPGSDSATYAPRDKDVGTSAPLAEGGERLSADAAVNDATGAPIGPVPGCYQDFPLDAAALVSIDAGDSGLLEGPECTALCGECPSCGGRPWFSCELVADAGTAFVRCYPGCA